MTRAVDLLRDGYHLDLSKGHLVQGSRFLHLLPPYHTAQVQKIVSHTKKRLEALQKIPNPDQEKISQTVRFADAFIDRYRNDSSVQKTMIAFDQHIAPHRKELVYFHPHNHALHEKWKEAKQPPEILSKHPQFAEYLRSSSLLKQISATRGQIIRSNGKEAAILVEGEWIGEAAFYERFKPTYSGDFRKTFLLETKTQRVYTCLDNGKGMELFHPFRSFETPISTLKEEEFSRVWESARQFVRPGEAKLSPEEWEQRARSRTCVLQIVSSELDWGDSLFARLLNWVLQLVSPSIDLGDSNIARFLLNPDHPWGRVIFSPELETTEQGKVYERGYCGPISSHPFSPFRSIQGRTLALDVLGNYRDVEHIVTNIAVTPEEAREARLFANRVHDREMSLGQKPRFHLLEQNCCVFVGEFCKAAGIELPREATLLEVLAEIAPERIQKIGSQIAAWTQNTCNWMTEKACRFIPRQIFWIVGFSWKFLFGTVKKVLDLAIIFFMVPIRALLGETSGETGEAFRQAHEPKAKIKPSWFNLFTSPKGNFPGVIQKWQLKQGGATVRFPKDHVRFTIVPPGRLHDEVVEKK